VLVTGPLGAGKATLARVIANEAGGHLLKASAAGFVREADLTGLLTGLDHGDVLFVGEVHKIKPNLVGYLVDALREFRVDFVLDKGPYARPIPLAVHPFTLVGATEEPHRVPAVLRSCFGLVVNLDHAQAQIAQLVGGYAEALSVLIDHSAAQEIAAHTVGRPSEARRLLRRARDRAQVARRDRIDLSVVGLTLSDEGIVTNQVQAAISMPASTSQLPLAPTPLPLDNDGALVLRFSNEPTHVLTRLVGEYGERLWRRNACWARSCAISAANTNEKSAFFWTPSSSGFRSSCAPAFPVRRVM